MRRGARARHTRRVRVHAVLAHRDRCADARALAVGAAQSNGGICVDLWHVVKLGIPYAEVAAFPREYLLSIELNDGYLKAPEGMDLVTETTCHRAFCGEGQFDVRGFVTTMRKAGYAGPWGIEVLNKAQRAWPLDELTTRAYAHHARSSFATEYPATRSGIVARVTTRKTFILIHGAWHGAWCWHKLVPLLEAQGHRVIAPDLPSMGADPTPPAP